MPIAKSARFVVSGTLAGGEVFAWGFWWDRSDPSYSGPNSQGDWDSAVNAVKTSWTTSFAAQAAALIRSVDHYTTLTGYYYGTGGTAPATYISSVSLGNLAGTGTLSHPDQTCMVVTLRTGLNNARGRGRMYLPATGVSMPAGLFADTTTVPTAIKAWWNGVFALKDVGVYSKADGAIRHVVALSVDSRPDIQRRRANKMTGVTSSTITL